MAKTSQRRQREHTNQAEPKLSFGGSVPSRMSSSAFKRPVTRVTSHPGNEVRCRQWEESAGKPQQRCWQKRLQGLQACGCTGELLGPVGLAKALQDLVPSSPGAPAGPSETAPGLSPHLCSRFLVTEDDVREQDGKVKRARERLATALLADRLARQGESAGTPAP